VYRIGYTKYMFVSRARGGRSWLLARRQYSPSGLAVKQPAESAHDIAHRLPCESLPVCTCPRFVSCPRTTFGCLPPPSKPWLCCLFEEGQNWPTNWPEIAGQIQEFLRMGPR